ncbi:NAD(P)H nitroreductase [Xanthobacter agilis]|jgi:nitroreductase|uniref:Putative NAD(P)H nitroreductase n=1 Tax=Xanthobacter agilis TaxID=47492 RepID=A0ABU0LDD0_XANAG|nr:NAD(P)H nitroreductase [Xanthobacter agilis]MDQ0505147.1 nitroreductase [Xanthobacter agilis]
MDALSLLLNRRSTTALEDPGPSGAELEIILRAALRVPDFQALRPYAFLIAEGEGRARLGRLMQEAAIASGRPQGDVARAAGMPLRAPLVIIVVAKARESTIVSRFEQQLSAGCAVMAMQMAAVALGYSGIWRSGWPMFDPHLATALELGADDRMVGFLYLGTPARSLAPAAPVNPQAFTRRL